MATSKVESAASQNISQSHSTHSNGTAQESLLAPQQPTEPSQVAHDPDNSLPKDNKTQPEPSDGPSHGEKRKDKGRNAYFRSNLDKRKRNDRFQERKRIRSNDDSVHGASQFTKEEIEAEGRRPKRKVAVLVGYAGTGYKGMQINGAEKTIEGDMFGAFVAAGAISKANADDPKKSSLSRCARTDKGVHAAGNVISLKLIIEDANIVDKINANLPPQIRVWAINRTNNTFNCYHSCDSRFYEYLMPSYTLLPPHPDSYLWKQLVKAAEEVGKIDEMKSNIADVADFWSEVEEKDIRPFLAGLEPEVLAGVKARLELGDGHQDQAEAEPKNDAVISETTKPPKQPKTTADTVDEQPFSADEPQSKPREPGAVDFALRDLRNLYIAAKRRYRVTPERLARLQDALGRYRGTHNFHNYTIHKGAKDPSARRHIKSFVVEPSPIVIGDTEWLSLKVHGQSFMMHQIRKMVAMATLLTRCGTDLDRIEQSFGTTRIAVPKAPSLGLWLERPVFAAYNSKVEGNEDRKAIDFTPFEKEIREFKDREIYSRIYKTEEEESTFYTFFQQVDSFKSNFFLWLTAKGLEAASIKAVKGDKTVEELDKQLGDEDEDPEGGEG